MIQSRASQHVHMKNTKIPDCLSLFSPFFPWIFFSHGFKQISSKMHPPPVKCTHHINYYRPGVTPPPPPRPYPLTNRACRTFRLLQGPCISLGNINSLKKYSLQWVLGLSVEAANGYHCRFVLSISAFNCCSLLL